jgi:aspartyl-tRNA(Asn)/glutamyl-tRNA(Gln) amidotransferase subunit A
MIQDVQQRLPMAGLSNAGLPLSLQLVGRYFDELAVLKAAAAFERETSFY